MKQPKPVTIDFETMGIEGRPKYPPVPVGVSIKYWGGKGKYYAWGHPIKNNCCWSDAKAALEEAYTHEDGMIFQNAKFDIDVANIHFDMPIPPWDKIHDTMFLLFLDDPHQPQLGLKPSAERLLGWAPEEQDAVCEWLVTHQPIHHTTISRSEKSVHSFGRYIAYAPGDVVGKYANGDTDRTEGLFKLLWRKTINRGMLEAYNRERQLMPVLLIMENQGLPVDLERLQKDVNNYSKWQENIDSWIFKRLNSEVFNINSGQQLFDAMLDAGKVDENKALLTPTGKYQTNKDALLIAVTDSVLIAILKYRSQLNTCLNTFMIPWLKTAKLSSGFIYTTWNQVKLPSRGDVVGTRTGRLSSTPNFQNIPNEFKPIFKHDAPKLKLPKCPFKDLLTLPKIRSYIIPFKGEVFIDRDYSQQEPRILAHFDGGALLDKYINEPWIDFHDYAKAELAKMGKYYERKPVKNINLGLIYGMGVGLLAEKTGLPVDETRELKKATQSLYPGLKEMYKDMRVRAANNVPIKTWGGREYFCEPPKIINGHMQTFDYKLVNILIQGSAADCTKEAIIRLWDEIICLKKVGVWKILLNVHDQVTACVPKKDLKSAMEVMRICMEGIEFDVQMLSEGSYSPNNWDDLQDYDIKGKMVA